MSDRISPVRVKLFADGAVPASLLELAQDRKIQGFITNPTLMARAGVRDYDRRLEKSPARFRTVLPFLGRDLTEYSLETVKMLFSDARSAGFSLNAPAGI